MLVLFLAILLLGVCPALLLWLGRKIAAVTDGRTQAAVRRAEPAPARDSGPAETSWFRRPMQPAFNAPLFRKR